MSAIEQDALNLMSQSATESLPWRVARYALQKAREERPEFVVRFWPRANGIFETHAWSTYMNAARDVEHLLRFGVHKVEIETPEESK